MVASEKPSGDSGAQAPLDSPPLWVTSPALRVNAGTVLRIEGWVRVPEPITRSVDGLMVFDSLGGEALAQRFDATGNGQPDDWRRFRFFRAVPRSGTMTFTFALTGIGEAFIDDIMVTELPLSSLGRLDQTLRMRDVFGGPKLRR